MLEVMHEPQTISQLSSRLHRNRSAITKDVGLLENLGLIVSNRESNPGHGIQKMIRAVAPKIEPVATLGQCGKIRPHDKPLCGTFLHSQAPECPCQTSLTSLTSLADRETAWR